MLGKILEWTLGLPLKVLGLFTGSLRMVLYLIGVGFFFLCCVALYSIDGVKKKVDPIMEKTATHTPKIIKKPVEDLAIFVGLMEPPKGFFTLVKEKIYILPFKVRYIVTNLGRLTLDKFLDGVFHPYTLLGVGFLFYLNSR